MEIKVQNYHRLGIEDIPDSDFIVVEIVDVHDDKAEVKNLQSGSCFWVKKEFLW